MSDTVFHEHIEFPDAGRLIASIPILLGFHPVDSLVVVGFGVQNDESGCLVLRADLPTDDADYAELAVQCVLPLISQHVRSACLIVVDGAGAVDERSLPHRHLLAACASRCDDVGLTIIHQLWASGTTEHATWQCYHDDGCTGVVPGPDGGTVLKAHVVEGVRVYRRREDIVATLAPVTQEHLDRRADLLARQDDWLPERTAAARLALVDAAIRNAADGLLPESDEDIVALVAFLCDHDIRDASIWQPDPMLAEAAERLWTVLVRGAPAPGRAEPASLLAFSAYQRGDGVLTGVALESAEAADPDHRLTGMLRALLALALSPDRIRHAAHRTTSSVRDQIEREAQS